MQPTSQTVYEFIIEIIWIFSLLWLIPVIQVTSFHMPQQHNCRRISKIMIDRYYSWNDNAFLQDLYDKPINPKIAFCYYDRTGSISHISIL